MKKSAIRRMVHIALFSCMALLCHIIENALPPLLPVAPGVRMGLANIFSYLAMILGGVIDGAAVLVIRCVLGTIFSGNIFALIYSLLAGACAYISMCLLYSFCSKIFSMIGISLACAMVHNTVQISVASMVMSTITIFYYLPYVLVVGSVAGIFTGAVVAYLMKHSGNKLLRLYRGYDS